MASYEDEHTFDGETPSLISLARFLIDYGFTSDFQTMFQSSRQPPPTSKKFIEDLETFKASKETVGHQCPVCLKEFELGTLMKKLPCNHFFHVDCILPWLKNTSSCPVCRFELPTDDPDYEDHKKQKKRKKDHEEDIKHLHNSMFT